jgi:hypothetical protein
MNLRSMSHGSKKDEQTYELKETSQIAVVNRIQAK